LTEDLSHFTNDITILIAEDNIMNQQLMKHLMSNWRMNYKIVSNGNEAVEVLTKEKFNLVLMDIQMPELDGYHATELIRGKLKLSVPVIAMTAHAMEGEKEKCISYGMSDYISKPIREQELYNLILLHTGRKNEATNNTGIINLDYLREISKGNKNFEEEMVREFIVQVPEEINTLQNAIQTHNLEMIKQVAHALKSSVSFVGLSSKLDPLLHNIETNAAGSGNIQVIAANFEQLRQLCDGAVKEARAMFA
ncbi:MAG: response regulator, partial [Chitinophagaceae bacterium]|nr:response regulator [Chitinophagaceae bacterium]